MADQDDVRERIISSVFNRRNAAGQQETYVGHLKIWEDAEDGVKPRYIILSHANNASGFIHKSKLNTNGSFSVGKTWNLSELRGIEVANSTNVNITLSRTYRWRTEDPSDLSQFVNGVVRTFRMVTSGAPLRLIGIQDPAMLGGIAARHLTDSKDEVRVQVNGSKSGSVTRTPSPVAPNEYSTISSSKLQHIGRSSSPGLNGMTPTKPQFAARPITPNLEPTTPRVPQGMPSLGSRPRRPSSASRASGATTPENVQSARNVTSLPADDRHTPVASKRPRTPSNASNPLPPSLNGSLFHLSPSSSHGPDSSRPSTASSHISTSTLAPNLTSLSIPPASRSSGALAFGSSQSQSRSNSPIPSSPGRSSTSDFILPSSYTVKSPVEFSTAQVLSPSRISPKVTTSIPSTLDTSLPLRAIDSAQSRNARISFFDPGNQTVLDRLVASDSIELNGMDGEEETVQATLASVEEMLEGYEWATDDILGRKGSTGSAEQIEARLLDELLALEKANVHSFIESDDRIGVVIKYLEQSIAELESMDSYVSSYKIHLNEVSEDISYIQSQNRGLQVQTQNQRALISELEQLLQTVHVDRDVLVTLTQEGLEKSKSIQRLEEAAAELYKALQAGRDRDIGATMERLGEYRTYNAQFCKRILDYLSIMFTAQSKLLTGDDSGTQKSSGKYRVIIKDHTHFEKYLGRYAGLILYLKEMDEGIYGKLCAAYFSVSSELHSIQMRALLSVYTDALKKTHDEDADQTFGSSLNAGQPKTATGIRRAGTMVRSPLGNKDKDRHVDGDLRGSECLSMILEALAPQMYKEKAFIADFLQINDAALTFADYMGLENYFCRQAMRSAGLSQATSKLVRGAMDLIFGFLPAALKMWIDTALASDKLGVIGILASIEQFTSRMDERDHQHLLVLLEKNHARLKAVFDRHVNEQIKIVEETKVTSKKRKGVVPFIKYFPIYIGRVESQIIGAESLEIRENVDAAYERIVQCMFDNLKHMAKMDGEGEDKGQLNYHVILIENMHHFVAEIAQFEIGSVKTFMKHAEGLYNENLNAYVKLVLRRPFSKILDFFEGVDRLLKTTAPTEVANNTNYNRSVLKKVVKEFTSKDVRKDVDALFKRVEKHFTEASDTTTQVENGPIAQGTVMVGVWRACEEELVRMTELFQKRISQCYANSGISLEYSIVDVEGAFRKHKISG